MIILTSAINKADFLQELSNRVGQPGALNVQVNELPSFIDSQVALTIFSYQLSNYPREIIWSSKNLDVLQILRDSQLTVSENYLKPHFPSEEVSAIHLNNLPINIDANNHYSEPEIAIDTSYLNKTGFFQNNTLEVIPNLVLNNSVVNNVEVIESSNNVQANTKVLSKKLWLLPEVPSNNLNTLSLAGLLTQEKYQPSSIISSNEVEFEEEKPVEKLQIDSANLDSWLERIEATREALNSLRRENNTVNDNLFNNLPSFAETKTRNKWLHTVTASSVASLLIVGFLIFFPTQAYTLEVSADFEDGTYILESSKLDLSKKNILLEAKQTIPTQNKEKTETERAVGTIKLINEGNRDVNLDNAKFQLVKDGFRYSPIFNNTLLKTFSIPAQNNKTDDILQFTIQSIPQVGIAGSSFNQSVGTRLKIVNLQDQSPCSSCYAVVTSEVSSKNGEGDNIVTEADYESLKNLVEQELQLDRGKEIQAIRADNIFTGKDWYQDTQSDYTFNYKVGEKSDNIALSATINTEVYYVLRSALEDKIRQDNPLIDKIKDMALLGSEGSLGSQNGIRSNFYYTYSKKVSVDTTAVSNLLAAKEFDQAKRDITEEYPEVKRIEKQDLGIKMPGLTPRKDIKIVEK